MGLPKRICDSCPLILGVFAWFRSDTDETFQTWSRSVMIRYRPGLKLEEVSGAVLSQQLVWLRTEDCAFCFPQELNDHRARMRPMDNLDNLIALTLYKLARLLSGAALCSLDRIHFEIQSRYMICKDALFRRTSEQWNWICIWNPF